MFTGIVVGCGVVEEFVPTKSGARLKIRPGGSFPVIKIGGSVAVNGTCLTVVGKAGPCLYFDVVKETIRRTNFCSFEKGTRVNLEPALRWNDRIEGHFVQGHVDCVGVVKKITRHKSDIIFKICYPRAIKSYVLEKGSVAVNGVSLTIGHVAGGVFSLYLIPHTLKLTNFGDLKESSLVNLEADILVKFFKTL